MIPEQVLRDIIINELDVSPELVVIYGGRFDAPKDDSVYILLKRSTSRVVASNNTFDGDTDEEVKSVTRYTTINVELISTSNDVLSISDDVLMSLTSNYAQRLSDEHSMRVFRTQTVTDLTAVEGSGPLYRFQIPVIISSVHVKRTNIEPYERFRDTDVEVKQ